MKHQLIFYSIILLILILIVFLIKFKKPKPTTKPDVFKDNTFCKSITHYKSSNYIYKKTNTIEIYNFSDVIELLKINNIILSENDIIECAVTHMFEVTTQYYIFQDNKLKRCNIAYNNNTLHFVSCIYQD